MYTQKIYIYISTHSNRLAFWEGTTVFQHWQSHLSVVPTLQVEPLPALKAWVPNSEMWIRCGLKLQKYRPKTQFRSGLILVMEEILHQLIGSLFQYLQGFIHPRWSRISSINSRYTSWLIDTPASFLNILGILEGCFFVVSGMAEFWCVQDPQVNVQAFSEGKWWCWTHYAMNSPCHCGSTWWKIVVTSAKEATLQENNMFSDSFLFIL